nr:MAG TPA: hypothetical protein [Caudoviricetes sp.]
MYYFVMKKGSVKECNTDPTLYEEGGTYSVSILINLLFHSYYSVTL